MTEAKVDRSIEVTSNGPYIVTGGIPVVRIEKVVNDENEPIAWRVYDELGEQDEWWLCRCGNSTDKPFCTNMHKKVAFDGTETAPTDRYADRAKTLGRKRDEERDLGPVLIKDDRGVCTHAGFCSNRVTSAWKAAKLIGADEELRETIVAMVQRCPSGALTVEVDGEPFEPELPVQVAVQRDGPLLVTGGVTIRRSDGQAIEVRNRVALCRCGESKNKPLCDGSHADAGFVDG